MDARREPGVETTLSQRSAVPTAQRVRLLNSRRLRYIIGPLWLIWLRQLKNEIGILDGGCDSLLFRPSATLSQQLELRLGKEALIWCVDWFDCDASLSIVPVDPRVSTGLLDECRPFQRTPARALMSDQALIKLWSGQWPFRMGNVLSFAKIVFSTSNCISFLKSILFFIKIIHLKCS